MAARPTLPRRRFHRETVGPLLDKTPRAEFWLTKGSLQLYPEKKVDFFLFLVVCYLLYPLGSGGVRGGSSSITR